jgi:hypothetical protein
MIECVDLRTLLRSVSEDDLRHAWSRARNGSRQAALLIAEIERRAGAARGSGPSA